MLHAPMEEVHPDLLPNADVEHCMDSAMDADESKPTAGASSSQLDLDVEFEL